MIYQNEDLSGKEITLTEQTVFNACVLDGASITSNGFGYTIENWLGGSCLIDGERMGDALS